MARINEEILVIKISTLLADQDKMNPIMDEENVQALKQVIEQLAGNNNKTLVEIERT